MNELKSPLFAQADDIFGSIVKTFESHFPERVCAYYVIGSYSDGTAVRLSDIDVFVIFKHQFADETEKEKAEKVSALCAAASPVRLDMTVWAEDSLDKLYPFIQVALKRGSTLLYGRDLREQMQLPDMATYTKDVIEGAFYFLRRLHGLEQLPVTLQYPDANAEFFGYTHKSIPAWYPLTIEAGTKELVATVSRIATAIVALETQEYVAGKGEAIRRLEKINGVSQGVFAAAVYQRCKVDWHYLIPETDAERSELNELCRHMLRFENDFLARITVQVQDKK